MTRSTSQTCPEAKAKGGKGGGGGKPNKPPKGSDKTLSYDVPAPE